MMLDIASVLGYIVLPLITVFGGYFMQSLLKRVVILEDKMQATTSEPQVRQLINDRYDPLAQDIREIKEKLDKLFDLYLHSQNK